MLGAMGLARFGLWFALVALGCGSPKSEQQGGAENTPFCRKVRRCLRETLPSRYRSSMHGQVLAKAADCLGHDARSVWTTRDCLPFEFARDDPSGIGLQVLVDCSDVCPMNAGIMLRFAEPVSALECACMGAVARKDADWGRYLGCSPVSQATAAWHPGVEEAPAGDSGFVVVADAEDPVSQALGFKSDLPVFAIDGIAMTSGEQLKELLEQMPTELPASIAKRTTRGRDAKHPLEVVLHYPPRAVFVELSRIAEEIDFAHVGPTASHCAGTGKTRGSLEFAGRVVGYDRDCNNDATKRLTVLASAIERAASDARPRRVTPSPPGAVCRELRGLPVSAALEEKGRATELRYVDWLAR